MSAQTVTDRFDAGAMNYFRIRTVALTLLISVLDGYDALSISFAAPAISTSWLIGKAALGVILSSSLAGMALGAFGVAPLADLFGRRQLTLFGLALMALGSLLSAFANSIEQLMLWRFLTGIGIGSCAAVINVVAGEFANARTRPMAMAIMSVGYPIGGLLGGLLASVLLTLYSWRSIFLAGFAAGTTAFALIMLFLPESLAFLLGREQPRRLERINMILRRSGLTPADTVPAIQAAQGGYAGVFDRAQRGVTLRLAFVSATNTAVSYFALSWMPQIVHLLGFAPSRTSLVAAAASLAGVVGGLVFGLFAHGSQQRRIAAFLIIANGLMIALFGLTPASLPLLLAAGGLCGFFLYAAATGFYAILPQSFEGSSRASGIGFVYGVGRVSSAAAPTLAGWLLSTFLSIGQVFVLFGAVAVIAGLVLMTHRSNNLAATAIRAEAA